MSVRLQVEHINTRLELQRRGKMDFEMRAPSLNLVLTEMASTPTCYNKTVSRFQVDGKCLWPQLKILCKKFCLQESTWL